MHIRPEGCNSRCSDARCRSRCRKVEEWEMANRFGLHRYDRPLRPRVERSPEEKPMSERMTIIVKRDPPPIPTRDHDYQAWVDGGEERYGTGTGASVADALCDLAQRIILKDE